MQLFNIEELSTLLVPVKPVHIPCGFPSPADDFKEESLDLNSHVIKHPSATYFARAEGDSLDEIGIYNGDLLVVDRALKLRDGHVIIAAINGELTCKIYDKNNNCLRAANPNYEPISLTDDLDTVLEGVVTHALHYLDK